ncbi:MAG: hypothetical protein D3903_09675 [Candidatus Electrothrix sp. GM3_4]|nr:hypothetical protein [Candidatus Electrothrix sp. GM3_4]
MNDKEKTKEEIMIELQELQKQHDSLKDFSEHISVEQVVKEKSEKFDSLFDKMLTGVVFCKAIYDENENISDCIYQDMNSAYEKFTGLKKETAIGKKVSEMLPGTEPEWFTKFSEVVTTGHSMNFEMYHDSH